MVAAGHKVEIEDASVIINDKITLRTEIVNNPNLHPLIMHLHTEIYVGNYFPGGLAEDLVGIGEDLPKKADSVLANFLNVSLPPILDAFTDSHNPDLDFETTTNGNRRLLWHPKVGDIGYQGQWDESETITPDYLLGVLKNSLAPELIDRKFNWLKLYVAKQADGSISGECSLNNQLWDAGFDMLKSYAETWKNQDGFRAIKQFIVFRLCDACDEQ
nr:DUF6348 family protein [Dysgonomonas sp. 216]